MPPFTPLSAEFTLAELMITLAVAAIALGGASHAFNDHRCHATVSGSPLPMMQFHAPQHARTPSPTATACFDGLHGCKSSRLAAA